MYYISKYYCSFFDQKNNSNYSDPFINEFYKYKRKKESWNTLKKRVVAIHKFWLYNLYFPKEENNTFTQYLQQYEETLTNTGFNILKKTSTEEYELVYSYNIYDYNKTTDPSFDFKSLKEYFEFITNEDTNPKFDLFKTSIYSIYTKGFNYNNFSNSKKYNKGSSYGLEAKGLMKEIYKKQNTIFDQYTNSEHYKKNFIDEPIKSFPNELFDELLKCTKNNLRRKLLYLLCAGTSARIGQALTLTIFDVDQVNKRVYLNDPLSNQKPIYQGEIYLNQQGRKDLLQHNYNIDYSLPKYINNAAFKYPIPLRGKRKSTNLYFFDKKYENMFFETYNDLFNNIDKDYPFVFQTQNKHIVNRSNMYKEFRKDMDSLILRFPDKKNLLPTKRPFHSLRHMFGVCMASYAEYLTITSDNSGVIILDDGKITNIKEIWQEFTSLCMGHSRLESTNIYFNTDEVLFEMVKLLLIEKQKEFNTNREIIKDQIMKEVTL